MSTTFLCFVTNTISRALCGDNNSVLRWSYIATETLEIVLNSSKGEFSFTASFDTQGGREGVPEGDPCW